MRIITEREDKLLERIQKLQSEIKMLDIEQIEAKGTLNECKEKRQAEFVKLSFWMIISTLLFILAMGYLIVGFNTPVLAASLFFASGGIGIISLVVWIITIIVIVKYIGNTAKNRYFRSKSDRNISFVEEKTKKVLSNIRGKITNYSAELEIAKNEYEKLKNQLDDLYEKGQLSDDRLQKAQNAADSIWQGNKFDSKEVIKGQQGNFEDFEGHGNDKVANFQTYEPWNAGESDKGKYNLLSAESVRIKCLRNQYEEDLVMLDGRKQNATKSVVYSLVYLAIMFFAFIAVIAQMLTSTVQAMDIKVLAAVGIILIASVTIFLFMFCFSLPCISSGNLSKLVVKVTGNEAVKERMDEIVDQIDKIDKRMLEIKEEMRLLESEIEGKESELPYLY